jgi:cyanophycin synthetase
MTSWKYISAERISRVIGLDICGVDIMAENLTQPLKENGGVILKVNAARF